jgi:hypothetical protein
MELPLVELQVDLLTTPQTRYNIYFSSLFHSSSSLSLLFLARGGALSLDQN